MRTQQIPLDSMELTINFSREAQLVGQEESSAQDLVLLITLKSNRGWD